MEIKCHDYGLDYHFNAKAWVTATFFNAWLRRVDAYIRIKPERKVALFLDNCGAHGTEEKLPLMFQVEVIFATMNNLKNTAL